MEESPFVRRSRHNATRSTHSAVDPSATSWHWWPHPCPPRCSHTKQNLSRNDENSKMVQNPLHCVKVSMLLDRPDKRPSFQLRSRCSMRNWAVTWRKWLHFQPTCTQAWKDSGRPLLTGCAGRDALRAPKKRHLSRCNGLTRSFSVSSFVSFSCIAGPTSSFNCWALEIFTPPLLLVLLDPHHIFF